MTTLGIELRFRLKLYLYTTAWFYRLRVLADILPSFNDKAGHNPFLTSNLRPLA